MSARPRRWGAGSGVPRAPLGLFAAVALLALTTGSAAAATAETIYEDLWQYNTSHDGLTHWLRLSAAEAEVHTPYGTMKTDAWPGQVPPMIEAFCREHERPLAVLLVMSAHPEEPVVSSLSLRNVWWWLTRTTPGPRTYPTVVRIGSVEFESTFELPALRYLEPDARIPLDPDAAVRQILASGERPFLLEATGRTRVKARFEAPDDYRAWLRHLLEVCP